MKTLDYLLLRKNDFKKILGHTSNASNPTVSEYIFINTLREAKTLLSQYIKKALPIAIQNKINVGRQSIDNSFLKAMNNIICKDEDLYEQERFKGIELSKQTTKLIEKSSLENYQRIFLNRLLLEAAYPREIEKRGRFETVDIKTLLLRDKFEEAKSKIAKVIEPIESNLKSATASFEISIRESMRNDLFPGFIDELWETILSEAKRDQPPEGGFSSVCGEELIFKNISYGGKICDQDFWDVLIGYDEFPDKIIAFWGEYYESFSRWDCIKKLYQKLSKDLVFADSQQAMVEFFSCWFDYVNDLKVAKELAHLDHRILSAKENIEAIYKKITNELKIYHHRHYPSVMLMSFYAEIGNRKKIMLFPYDEKEAFPKHLLTENDNLLYVQIDASYNKKEILIAIDNILTQAQKALKIIPKHGRADARQEELGKLIEHKFFNYRKKDKLSITKALRKVSEELLKETGISIDVDSLKRRYIPKIRAGGRREKP